MHSVELKLLTELKVMFCLRFMSEQKIIMLMRVGKLFEVLDVYQVSFQKKIILAENKSKMELSFIFGKGSKVLWAISLKAIDAYGA